MDKKGDLPITILTIGVFAVCGLALLSFFSSSIQIKNSFTSLGFMEQINFQIEQYNFYKNLGISDEKMKPVLEIKNDVQGKFLYLEEKKKQREKWYSLWRTEKISFSVKYLLGNP